MKSCLSQRVGPTLRIEANASWVDAKDSRNPQLEVREQEVAAPWMANLSSLWNPGFDFVASLRWNHVADRDAGRDVRNMDDSYDLVDVTLTKSNLFTSGLSLRVGVKNVLDDVVVYYAPLPIGNVPHSHRTRAYWARLSWRR